MTVEREATSLQLDRIRWAQGEAIRSGQETSERTVGRRGQISEAHHAYAFALRGISAARAPDAQALATNGTTSYTTVASLPYDHASDFTSAVVYVDCADAEIEVDVFNIHGTKTASSGTTSTAREVLEISVTVAAKTARFDVKLRRNVTSGTYYGCAVRDVAILAAELPTS